jgi:hypothetical protein
VTGILAGRPGVKTAVAARQLSVLQDSQAASGVLLIDYQAYFSRCNVPGHSPPSSVEETNACNYASTPCKCTHGKHRDDLTFNVSDLNALSRQTEEMKKTKKSFGQDQKSTAEV